MAMDSSDNTMSFLEVESTCHSAAVSLLTDLQYVEDLTELVSLIDEWSIGDSHLFGEGINLLIESFPREFFGKLGVSLEKIESLGVNDFKYFINELVNEIKVFNSSDPLRYVFVPDAPDSGETVSLLRKFSVLRRLRHAYSKNIDCICSIDQIVCSWGNDFERILAAPHNQASNILDLLTEVALSKTVARKRVFQCRRPFVDTGVPPKTREQIQTFAIRTGNPPPASIFEKLFQSSLSLREGDLSTEDGGQIGHSKLCRTMVGRGIQDRQMQPFGCRSNQSRLDGARPFRRSQSFAGLALSTFTSPVEGSGPTRSLSHSRPGRDLDQFHLATSGLHGCSTRVNSGRW
jgi:hypothetical protein